LLGLEKPPKAKCNEVFEIPLKRQLAAEAARQTDNHPPVLRDQLLTWHAEPPERMPLSQVGK
jgi:hypothetical protein